MSTSDDAPLELGRNTQEPCDTCSSTAGGCAECQPLRSEGAAKFREHGLTTGARRRLKAEMAHRVAIEPWGERSRQLPFPWGLAIFGGVLFGLACFAAGWALSKAWWW